MDKLTIVIVYEFKYFLLGGERMRRNRFNLAKAIVLFAAAIGCFYVQLAFAADTTTAVSGLAGIASNLQASFAPIAKLITGGSFLAGLGFAFAAILKFKAHRDNPTQIPVGTPIALILVAGALLYLPFLFGQVGRTLFGGASQFGVTGISGIVF